MSSLTWLPPTHVCQIRTNRNKNGTLPGTGGYFRDRPIEGATNQPCLTCACACLIEIEDGFSLHLQLTVSRRQANLESVSCHSKEKRIRHSKMMACKLHTFSMDKKQESVDNIYASKLLKAWKLFLLHVGSTMQQCYWLQPLFIVHK